MNKMYKKIAMLLTLVLVVSMASVSVVAQEIGINVGKLKYYVNDSQVFSLSEIRAGDVVNSEVKVSGTGQAYLISAIYNCGDLENIDVSDCTISNSSKVLKTSMALPKDYGKDWEYKCFIWNDLSSSLMPYKEAEFEFSLEAIADIESVKLIWDAVDGYMGDPLYIYRNDVKIATAQAGQGIYIDNYESADLYEQASYYISNESGTRKSNIVTAAPISVKSILDNGGYVNYNKLVDGIPAQRAIKAVPNQLKYYDGMDDSSKVADTGEYLRGYAGGNDNSIIKVANDTLYSRTASTSATAYTTAEATKNLTNDNSSYIIKAKNYAKISTSNGSISKITNVSHTGNWCEYVFDRTLFGNFGTGTTADFVLFVEYWNTGSQDFAVVYSMNNDDLDTNGTAATGKISSRIKTTLPAKTQSTGNWSVAQFTLKNMSYQGYSYATYSSKMAIDLVTLNSEVAIRSIVLLPKNIADDINATSNPQRLFSSINENYTGTCASFYVNNSTITQSNMKVNGVGGDGTVIKENDHIAIAPYVTTGNTTNRGYRVRLNIDDSYIYTPGTNGVQIEITYATNYYTYLPIKYMNSAGTEQTPRLGLVNDGKKNIAVMEINDIALINTLFGTAEKRDMVLDMVSNREGSRTDEDYSERYLHIYEFKLRRPMERQMMDLSK